MLCTQTCMTIQLVVQQLYLKHTKAMMSPGAAMLYACLHHVDRGARDRLHEELRPSTM